MRWAWRPRRHLRRRLRGEGAFNGIGIPQVFPVLSREVRLRTGEAPPLRRDLLEALDGRLAVYEFAHRPDECLKILKPAFDFGSRSGKNGDGSNSLVHR